jgi:hypothetical protein
MKGYLVGLALSCSRSVAASLPFTLLSTFRLQNKLFRLSTSSILWERYRQLKQQKNSSQEKDEEEDAHEVDEEQEEDEDSKQKESREKAKAIEKQWLDSLYLIPSAVTKKQTLSGLKIVTVSWKPVCSSLFLYSCISVLCSSLISFRFLSSSQNPASVKASPQMIEMKKKVPICCFIAEFSDFNASVSHFSISLSSSAFFFLSFCLLLLSYFSSVSFGNHPRGESQALGSGSDCQAGT